MHGSTASNVDDVDPTNSRRSTSQSLLSSSLKSACAEMHSRVTALLDEDTSDEVLQQVQSQTRISLKVLDEALDRYG